MDTAIAGMDFANGIIGMRNENLQLQMIIKHISFIHEELIATKMLSMKTNTGIATAGTTSEVRLCVGIGNFVKRMILSHASKELNKLQS